MPDGDNRTIRFYAENAERYAGHRAHANIERLKRLLSGLPAGARVLELGCGNGRDSAWMLARGLDVTPSDGVPEMAREAERLLGIPVLVLAFEDVDMVDAFEAVWASACLLHVPRSRLGIVLQKIYAALRTGGLFYASFKAGEAEGLDSLGRYYNYPSPQWLLQLYEQLAWASLAMSENDGGSFDGEPTRWLHVVAKKA
jgi:SAM-dependent methyltransferase